MNNRINVIIIRFFFFKSFHKINSLKIKRGFGKAGQEAAAFLKNLKKDNEENKRTLEESVRANKEYRRTDEEHKRINKEL